jgi:predicted TIM-barrel fold metal-dependent hydrolase
VHTHFLPPAYRSTIERRSKGGGGFGIQPEWSAELHLAMMATYGIDTAIVSISDPGIFFGDQGETTALARTVNDAAAELKAAHPGRFGAFAALPLPDIDAALAELTYALDVLHLDGVGLLSHNNGVYVGSPELDPLFAELDRRGTYVFVHPTVPQWLPPIPFPHAITEFPFDTTRAVYNLIYSGTLERFKNVRVHIASCGGAAPFLAHRIAIAGRLAPALAEAAPAGPLSYLARLYYDTAVADNEQMLSATLATADVTHLLYGSDWPYAAKLLPPAPDPAPGLAFLADRRALVEQGNAENLFPQFARHR